MTEEHADRQTISAIVQGYASTSRATELAKLTTPQRPAERRVVGRGHLAGALLSCALLARQLRLSEEVFLDLAREALRATRNSSDPLAALARKLIASDSEP